MIFAEIIKKTEMPKKINCSMVFVFRFVYVICSWTWKVKAFGFFYSSSFLSFLFSHFLMCILCGRLSNTLISTKSFSIWSYIFYIWNTLTIHLKTVCLFFWAWIITLLYLADGTHTPSKMISFKFVFFSTS